jgi:hypothetical protein
MLSFISKIVRFVLGLFKAPVDSRTAGSVIDSRVSKPTDSRVTRPVDARNSAFIPQDSRS